ncbi:glutathione transferase [Caenorhabditis elegans]|uniref:glutathione transferase n=1 Tax=Caenorhabditis elegans TaxID=6239 RepID=Q9NAB1_CAEEL|nr:Glutathione S-Transferase [Caenorhabditis elegans]CAB61106.1 Glutathione S-Transferase [Caenorhabditis elegans]|eukprot:NP_497118.1 Glutathione S-Transferase [Caenorhabditis elegans]
MPTYKLSYFDVRAYAEPARILFHLAGVPFDDHRFPHGDGTWEKLKDKTPFGQVPVLYVDGFEIPQSAAIIRYLANKFGYAGKTPEEQAWADAIVDQFKDFMSLFREFKLAQKAGKSDVEIAKVASEVAIPARDSYFEIITNLLEKSKSGFLVGDGLTFADIVVVESLTNLEKVHFFDASEHPKLAALREKIYAIPAIKSWVDIRPDTIY